MVLREETSVLQDLFGLQVTPKSSFFSPSPSRTLFSSPIKDVLFLSIDIDGSICQPEFPKQFHLGISILDTRDLQTLVSSHVQNGLLIDGFENDIQSIFQTHNLCYGPQKYCDRVWRRFIFGHSQDMTIEKMDGKIQSLISGRDVVLVVHGGGADLQFLARLRISIRPIHIIDTQKAAQTPLQLTYRPSLENFLTRFQIPFVQESLHTAGNDANYALRTLLMIAVTCSEQEEGLNSRQRIYFRILQALAQTPPPIHEDHTV